jgi:hypothetical protein
MVAASRQATYILAMANLRRLLPDHDLMIHLVWGKHDAEEAIQFVRDLDDTCAVRWLCYYHPSVDMAGMDVAHLPAVKRAVTEKRSALFGDKPKPHALACASKASDHFFDFWRRYDSSAGARSFHSLDEAYDFLGLSQADRKAATAAIERFEADIDAGRPVPEPAHGRGASGRPAPPSHG